MSGLNTKLIPTLHPDGAKKYMRCMCQDTTVPYDIADDDFIKWSLLTSWVSVHMSYRLIANLKWDSNFKFEVEFSLYNIWLECSVRCLEFHTQQTVLRFLHSSPKPTTERCPLPCLCTSTMVWCSPCKQFITDSRNLINWYQFGDCHTINIPIETRRKPISFFSVPIASSDLDERLSPYLCPPSVGPSDFRLLFYKWISIWWLLRDQ